MIKIVKSKTGDEVHVMSPTRVDLAGGTLDLWPIYNFVGGASTVNVAVDIYTKVMVRKRKDKKIILTSSDLNFKKEFASLKVLSSAKDPQLQFFKALLNYFKPDYGFELLSSSQSPVGGGLGGSSSLMISHIKAFSALNSENAIGQTLGSYDMVKLAHNIEAQVLNTPTGTQDYFPAVHGGINIIDYKADGWLCEVLDLVDSEFGDRFLLAYTGKSHRSGLNNFKVLMSAVQRDKKVMQALDRLREVSEQVALAVRSKRWNQLSKLFQLELKYRLMLTPYFSSPEIKKLTQLSLKAGANAVKICGAGGGGCVLIWVSPKKRQGVISACQNSGFQVLQAKPVSPFPKGL
jgi:D-glycero-alpha-D-manno-heptose-7-phosphate kinase